MQPERPPSLKPLQLGESSLLGRSYHGRRKSSFGHSKRPSISAPNSFRRLEHTEGQRASLVPLRLAPVVLSESPTSPHRLPMTVTETVASQTRKRSDSTQELLSNVNRESYRNQRDTPFQRCQQRSSAVIVPQPTQPSQTIPSPTTASSPTQRQPGIQVPISTQSSSSSLRKQAMETSASSVSNRPSLERHRLKRKPSLQSIRKPHAESGDLDVDKEVLELNTIVEERRAEIARSNSPEQHIAAVAPSLQLRARSETLNDIGSAFARPFTAREPARFSDIFDTPEKPKRPSTSRATSRSSSRVSGWLSSLMPTTSAPAPSQEPFYKCVPLARQRAHSEASLCISCSVTELESPSLTAASSPTSKGHSRSLTAESRLSPLSPPSTIYGHDLPDHMKEAEANWPIVAAPPSQVGLAI